MTIKCLFCEKDVTGKEVDNFSQTSTMYMCSRCGFINLDMDVQVKFNQDDFSKEDRNLISISLRNIWERSNKSITNKKITYTDLSIIKRQFVHLNPIEKLDNALLIISKKSKQIGDEVNVNFGDDYPLYYCTNPKELISVLKLLVKEDYIASVISPQGLDRLSITTRGYQKIIDLEKYNKESNQCFVAMWFNDEMNQIYESSIKKAIEFIAPGEDKPRFKAVKIDNIEHTNDINDEIIAQIRRSRFMVCDLTGYRGGVYFEAGFAYGLGLDVIYTCRNDWTKDEYLEDGSGTEIKFLFDSTGNEILIKKDGIHFDLAHRNRIEWSLQNLEEFTRKLTNRIRALIC